MWWRWYSWACPLAFTLYGLIASQFGDVDDKILRDTNTTVKDYIEDYFGFEHDNVWIAASAVAGFSIFFAFTFALGIRTLNFQKR